MSRELRATYRITTPMFLGDADQAAPTRIRPPSVRGALRWWWRASMWPEVRRDAEDDAAALQKLNRREAMVWGAASRQEDGEEKGGQGVILRVRTLGKLRYSSATLLAKPSNGLAYLLGQGIYDRKKGYQRAPIKAGARFEVRLLLQPNRSLDCVKGLADALWLWGTLGGLGSRARRGVGSVAIESLEERGLGDAHSWLRAIPANPDALLRALHPWFGNGFPEGLPPLTAFSPSSRVDCSLVGPRAEVLLDRVGQRMLGFRGPNKDAALKADGRLVMAAAKGVPPGSMPRRAVFGLPHDYFFKTWPNRKVGITPNGPKRDRRASPLLIHIHRFSDGRHAAIQALLPSRFLAACDGVTYEASIKRGGEFVPSNVFDAPAQPVDWDLLRTYMDQFESRTPRP